MWFGGSCRGWQMQASLKVVYQVSQSAFVGGHAEDVMVGPDDCCDAFVRIKPSQAIT
jgi:hypothetical protein